MGFRRVIQKEDAAKSTTFALRPNAKFPWCITQRNNEVKLSEYQMQELVRLYVIWEKSR